MMFSIIATDYEGVVPQETLQRFIDSLKAQTFKDFEVIILHDGKRNRPTFLLDTEGLMIKWIESDFNAACSGHNLRTLGMKLAKGEYYIHTNTDNVYYPNALLQLSEAIKDNPLTGVFFGHVKMVGLNREYLPGGMIRVWYDNPRDYTKHTILTANPPVFANMDMMSMTAHRKIWENIGYWYDLRPASDALIYEDICSKNHYENTTILIGEHY